MSHALTTHDLCRYYQRGPQEIRAVDKVNIAIAHGEFVAVIGSSGSGKSTLLNLLAGLDTLTGGDIRFDGTSFASMSRRELSGYRARHVGMIFQSFNLLPYKTAQENVEMALYFTDVTRSERHHLAAHVLDTLGLADRRDHKPADLSGGEQQRVAIARALVKKPSILFADEPTGNLDHDNAVQIAQLIASLHANGTTIVMVSHNVELARAYSDRIVRMEYGSLVETDSGAPPS